MNALSALVWASCLSGLGVYLSYSGMRSDEPSGYAAWTLAFEVSGLLFFGSLVGLLSLWVLG